MKNVLAFPCGSEIGLEVNRALSYSTHFTLFGANSVDDHGKFVYKNYISGLPFINDDTFIDKLNEVISKYNIDYIVPTHDSAVVFMAENQNKINAIVITSPETTCKICRSKGQTYSIFKDLIPTPTIYNSNTGISFPVFLKPDIGQGSKGTYIAKNKEDVDFYIQKDNTLLILEYLPGKEYTIDCFTNKDGFLLFAEGRERKRINGGISVNSKPIKNSAFQELAKKINNKLKFQGVWFFQVKERASGEFVLMEISPRIAGTMALYRVMGINFIQMSLFDKMGLDISVLKNDLDIEIDRALFSRYLIRYDYEYVYLDFDDTTITNNTVNTEVIRFIYQSKNKGKKIILITRHKENIHESLSKFMISDKLFDSIIQLDKNQKKSDFINNTNSIFIDDSFAERKNVNNALKIPCFSVDAIESLIEWKN